MSPTKRVPHSISKVTADVSPDFNGYRRRKATNLARLQPTKSVTFSPPSTRASTKPTAEPSSAPPPTKRKRSVPTNPPASTPSSSAPPPTKRKRSAPTNPPASTPSSSTSSLSIIKCRKCGKTDHQRSTSNLCLYFKGKQTTSARLSSSTNVDSLDAIFETISDEDILAALAEDDEMINMAHPTTVELEDSEEEDEPLIRRQRPDWNNISRRSSPGLTTIIQMDDDGEADLQRPLTQVSAIQSTSSSYASSSLTLTEWTPPMPSTTRLDTTSGCMAIVCPSCSSRLSLTAVLE